MSNSPCITRLISSLRCLPGIGPKTAQRLAFHILARDRAGGQRLAQSLHEAIHTVQHCHACRNFSETDLCGLCQNSKRDHNLLCVVETPADIVSIEQTGSYSGLYFVLMGRLSPLDGVGPSELGIPLLLNRITEKNVKELILATNPTAEGDATAHFIAQIVKPHTSQTSLQVSRIANGVPLGGELGWVSSDTLSRALVRREVW